MRFWHIIFWLRINEFIQPFSWTSIVLFSFIPNLFGLGYFKWQIQPRLALSLYGDPQNWEVGKPVEICFINGLAKTRWPQHRINTAITIFSVYKETQKGKHRKHRREDWRQRLDALVLILNAPNDLIKKITHLNNAVHDWILLMEEDNLTSC